MNHLSVKSLGTSKKLSLPFMVNYICTKCLNNMKRSALLFLFILLCTSVEIRAQADSVWTLEKCIDFALSRNIQVRQSELTNQQNKYSSMEARASRYPSVNASVNQNFDWVKNSLTGGTGLRGTNGNNYSVSSGVTLFNASRLSNQVKQSEINIEAGEFSLATTKESISLNILNAYLQVLYAEEQVKNSQKQIESTQSQLDLAHERLLMQVISQADYAQVKSQLASEKLTLATSQSSLAIAKVNLEQLMELPVRDSFNIAHPNLEGLINQNRKPDVKAVYQTALGIKPQIKNAAANKEIAALSEKIAKAGYFPILSADAGMTSGYYSRTSSGYFSQINNNISPSVGLSLSIPIYQKRQIKTSVDIAKLNYQNAELSEINTKNDLRKSIEQACQDVTSAQVKYEASVENYQATQESSALNDEKFRQGIINSTDYLVSKTNLIVAESDLLQAKFNLIFSYKILDFYLGVPLSL
jgi:outer membrane protein